MDPGAAASDSGTADQVRAVIDMIDRTVQGLASLLLPRDGQHVDVVACEEPDDVPCCCLKHALEELDTWLSVLRQGLEELARRILLPPWSDAAELHHGLQRDFNGWARCCRRHLGRVDDLAGGVRKYGGAAPAADELSPMLKRLVDSLQLLTDYPLALEERGFRGLPMRIRIGTPPSSHALQKPGSSDSLLSRAWNRLSWACEMALRVLIEPALLRQLYRSWQIDRQLEADRHVRWVLLFGNETARDHIRQSFADRPSGSRNKPGGVIKTSGSSSSVVRDLSDGRMVPRETEATAAAHRFRLVEPVRRDSHLPIRWFRHFSHVPSWLLALDLGLYATYDTQNDRSGRNNKLHEAANFVVQLMKYPWPQRPTFFLVLYSDDTDDLGAALESAPFGEHFPGYEAGNSVPDVAAYLRDRFSRAYRYRKGSRPDLALYRKGIIQQQAVLFGVQRDLNYSFLSTGKSECAFVELAFVDTVVLLTPSTTTTRRRPATHGVPHFFCLGQVELIPEG
ncbi:hypothetical protein GGR56DRAFT_673377 [Xylariaceae sp. FL0804]|nr:hypothetical protein GGR56DRAFT_673377 [Xylariaceae sp. FL0804]